MWILDYLTKSGKEKKRSAFVSLLVSYIIVLLVPIFIGGLLYNRMSSALIENANKSQLGMLEQIRQSVDSRILEVEQLTSRIAFHPKLQWLLNNSESSLRNQEIMIDFIKVLHNYKLVDNQYISDFFIFLSDTETILSPTVKADAKMYFDILNYTTIDYDTYLQLVLSGYHVKDYIPSNKVSDGTSGERLISYVQSLPLGEKKQLKGSLVILIDEQQIVHMLENVEWASQGTVFILNEQQQLLLYSGSLDQVKQLTAASSPLKQEYASYTRELFGEDVMVSLVKSKRNGWTYVSAVPKNVVMSKVNEVKRWAVILLFLYLLGGAGISWWLAYKNYSPVKKVVTTILNRKSLASGTKFNEFDLIQKAITDSIKEEQQLKETLSKQKPVIQANFLLRLIRGHVDPSAVTEDALDFMGLHFESDFFAVVVVEIEDTSGFAKENTEREWAFVRFIISNVSQELLDGRGYAIELDRERVAILVNPSDMESRNGPLWAFSQELMTIMNARFRMGISIAVGAVHSGAETIAVSYQEALLALDYKMLHGVNSVIFYNDITGFGQQQIQFSLEKETKLLNLGKQGDYEGVEKLLDEVYETNFTVCKITPEMGKCLFLDLTSALLKLVNMVNFNTAEWYEEGDLIKHILKASTAEDMLTRLKDAFSKLCTRIKNERNGHSDQLYRKIVDYIEYNYHSPSLSLTGMADHFGITPQYLSFFFKKNGGQNLSDYIAKIRVDRSKQLLADRNLTLADIAEKIGFTNNVGFIRVFKKIEGVTPGKYRDSIEL